MLKVAFLPGFLTTVTGIATTSNANIHQPASLDTLSIMTEYRLVRYLKEIMAVPYHTHLHFLDLPRGSQESRLHTLALLGAVPTTHQAPAQSHHQSRLNSVTRAGEGGLRV